MKILLLLTFTIIATISFGQTSMDIKIHENEISYISETSACLITDVYKFGNETYVTVDFIRFEDYVDSDGYENYRMVNTNPKKRTYKITSQTKFSEWDNNTKLSDLIKASKAYETFFYITCSNGKAIKLFQNQAG